MKRVLSLCLSLCLSLSVWADPAGDLNQLLAKAATFKAQFSQQVLSNSGAVLQQSSGSVAIKRPGLFRWEVDKPMKQITVSDGKKVWMYEPDLAQVTIKNLDTNLAKTPVLLLTQQATDLSQSFTVAKMKQHGEVWYTLTPKQDSPLFQSLKLGFSGGTLDTLRLSNNLGQTTLIHFSDQNENSDISNSEFKLHWPKGTTVVNMDGQ